MYLIGGILFFFARIIIKVINIPVIPVTAYHCLPRVAVVRIKN